MITEEMKSTLLDIEINNPEGIRYYGYYLIAKSMGIKSEKEFVEKYREILSIINE